MKKILFIFAHPDDEAFNVGGLLVRLGKNENLSTILYCATPGDAGKCGEPPVCKKEELGEIRKKELKEAGIFLGINHIIVDDFSDGTLHLHTEALTKKLTELIDEVEPHTIITFSSHGISMHKDHIAVHFGTLKALEQTRHSIANLYYVTYPTELKNDRSFLEKEQDIDLSFSFTESEMQRVKQALLSHSSQHLTVERVFGNIASGVFKKYNNKEYFLIGFEKDNNFTLSTFVNSI